MWVSICVSMPWGDLLTCLTVLPIFGRKIWVMYFNWPRRTWNFLSHHFSLGLLWPWILLILLLLCDLDSAIKIWKCLKSNFADRLQMNNFRVPSALILGAPYGLERPLTCLLCWRNCYEWLSCQKPHCHKITKVILLLFMYFISRRLRISCPDFCQKSTQF